MIKRALLLVATTALLAALAAPAQATFIADVLTSGVNNIFEDNSREAVVDVNNNNVLDVGDVLIGFVRIDFKDPGAVNINNRIYSIFSQQVASVVVAGANTAINFVPTTQVGLRISDIVPGAPASSLTAVYSSPNPLPVNLITTSPGNVAGGPNINLFDYFASIQANSQLSFIAGFAATDPEDFFQANVATAINGNLSLLPTTSGSLTFGSFSAGMSILVNNDPQVIYNDNVQALNPVLGVTLHQLVVAAGSINGQADSSNNQEWDNVQPNVAFANPGGTIDNADFVVNPSVIPEPATMTMFSLGIAGFSAVGWLRRKKRVANT